MDFFGDYCFILYLIFRQEYFYTTDKHMKKSKQKTIIISIIVFLILIILYSSNFGSEFIKGFKDGYNESVQKK